MLKLKLFWQHAKGKVTTYVALAIAGLAQLSTHAQAILDQMPSIKPYLPNGPIVSTWVGYVITALGFLAIYTRVRRLLQAPAP